MQQSLGEERRAYALVNLDLQALVRVQKFREARFVLQRRRWLCIPILNIAGKEICSNRAFSQSLLQIAIVRVYHLGWRSSCLMIDFLPRESTVG